MTSEGCCERIFLQGRGGRTDSAVGGLGSIPVVGGEVPQLIDDVFVGDMSERRRGEGSRGKGRGRGGG